MPPALPPEMLKISLLVLFPPPYAELCLFQKVILLDMS